eukprot:CAMPEP_0178795232 /NCGR_PEP_ID=MMETSP0745-20121128/10010_1 /TAXON_ID=913974 /ORGANISM="Nitzschia punctata, Strain CCMP561" /LENGTH=58 /DNA_ID=CAMNT_0020453599 /DNA_START=199 /DNA_END=375 /DNA_ORIENTATION=+
MESSGMTCTNKEGYSFSIFALASSPGRPVNSGKDDGHEDMLVFPSSKAKAVCFVVVRM